MKLLKITSSYSSYINNFYRDNNIGIKSYNEQIKAFKYDEFAWFGAWEKALEPFGYEVEELIVNATPLQLAWARENGIKEQSLSNIVLEQVKKFKPDILWYDCMDKNLIKMIKQEVPSVRLNLGWVGSAISSSNIEIYRQLDLVLTCAPESVERLTKWGIKSAHLNHAFDNSINDKIKNLDNDIDLSFIGQILRGEQYHLQRERMLESLSNSLKIDIYSSSSQYGYKDNLKTFMKICAYNGVNFLRSIGFNNKTIGILPKGKKIASWESKPMYPVNRNLKPFIKEPLFGLKMFQAIKNSKVSLNIHADSSPKYASNMRLFEITGVGSCMVVDHKENIRELFEPDYEVVTYKTEEECIEKVKWLINNPYEREKIAKAGQKRTLKEHTFDVRANRLNYIINNALK